MTLRPLERRRMARLRQPEVTAISARRTTRMRGASVEPLDSNDPDDGLVIHPLRGMRRSRVTVEFDDADDVI